MIEACLLQTLGLNDCVCSWSVIEYVLYFIKTLPNTHRTTQPPDKTPAVSISLILHFFFLLFLSFSLSCFLSLCLTALIPHLSQFLSFHLMEATGRQNEVVIKHGLCNSHGTAGCLLCRSLPLVQCLSLPLDFPLQRLLLTDTYLCRFTPNHSQTNSQLLYVWGVVWMKWIPVIYLWSDDADQWCVLKCHLNDKKVTFINETLHLILSHFKAHINAIKRQAKDLHLLQVVSEAETVSSVSWQNLRAFGLCWPFEFELVCCPYRQTHSLNVAQSKADLWQTFFLLVKAKNCYGEVQ